MNNSIIKYKFPEKLKTLFSIFIFIGFVTFLVGLFIDKERIWHAFLSASSFVLF